MISLDWTLMVGGAVFLLTLLFLNKLLFKPLLKVMDERESRTSGMMAASEKTLQRHRELFDQYKERIHREKAHGYQLAESVRKQTMEEHQQAVVEARSRAQELLERARQEIEKEVTGAREELRREASEIAEVITSRILERR